MSEERKKSTLRTPPKLEPKKRVEEEPIDEPKLKKYKEIEYLRVGPEFDQAALNEIGQRVQRGELKLRYSAIDGNKFYRYYTELVKPSEQEPKKKKK